MVEKIAECKIYIGSGPGLTPYHVFKVVNLKSSTGLRISF